MGSILDALGLFIDYIVTALESLFNLITYIPLVMEGVYGTIAYAPSFIAPFLILSGCITVIFAIIRLF